MEFQTVLLCIVFVFHGINGLLISQTSVRKTETDLRQDLFRRYDKLVRPVSNPMSAVSAWVDISPLNIRDLDEQKEMLTMDAWLRIKWVDDFLQWDPEMYSGLTSLNLPATEVWRPDFTLYTGSPDTAYLPKILTQVLINYTGEILWVPPFTINSRCPLEVSKVPKKTQMCNIKIGSWTYSGKQLDIQKYSEDVDISNFEDTNPDWQLLSVTSDRQSKHYPCCVDDYPLVEFNVTLRRRASPSFRPHKLKPEISTFLALLRSQNYAGNESIEQ